MRQTYHHHRSHNQRGFSLTEAAIGLGVLGLIIGAVWGAASSVNDNRLVTKTYSNLMVVMTNIKQLYKNSSNISNTSNFTTANMVRAGVFPADMLDSSDDPKTQWDTDISLSAPNDEEFEMTYNNIPTQHCRNLVGRMAGRNHDPRLVQIRAAGRTYYGNFNGNNTLRDLVATDSQLNSCSTVVFRFKIK